MDELSLERQHTRIHSTIHLHHFPLCALYHSAQGRQDQQKTKKELYFNPEDATEFVSSVSRLSGHGEGWNGHHEGDDEILGSTLDDNTDRVHPAELAVRTRKEIE